MKRFHLSALSLAMVLGVFLGGCGEDKSSPAKPAGGAAGAAAAQKHPADLYAARVEPELRRVINNLGDAEERSSNKIVAFKELAKTDGVALSAVDTKELDSQLAKLDALKRELLTRFNSAAPNKESIDLIKEEVANFEYNADVANELVSKLAAKYKLDDKTVRVFATTTKQEHSPELYKRIVLASTYDVDDHTDQARAEALEMKKPWITARVNELDAKFMDIRRRIASSNNMNAEIAANFENELKAIEEDYKKAKDTRDPVEVAKEKAEIEKNKQKEQQKIDKEAAKDKAAIDKAAKKEKEEVGEKAEKKEAAVPTTEKPAATQKPTTEKKNGAGEGETKKPATGGEKPTESDKANEGGDTKPESSAKSE